MKKQVSLIMIPVLIAAVCSAVFAQGLKTIQGRIIDLSGYVSGAGGNSNLLILNKVRAS